MRSTCPSCDSAYDIPDGLLGSGRKVRCASCGQTWTVAPLHPAPEAAAPPGPDVEQAEAPPAWPEPPSRLRMEPLAAPGESRSAWAAWAATFVVIAIAGAGAVVWRDRIMQAWPPSARAYQAVGLVPEAPPARVNGGSAASP